MMEEKKVRHILNQFALYGNLESFKGFGNGHINNTYLSVWNQGGTRVRYTHQRINKNVFKNPEQVVQNIHNVTGHIYHKLSAEQNASVSPSRRVLQLVPAKDGKLWFLDEEGDYWRTYVFIEHASTLEIMSGTDLAYKVGKAVGTFQKQLSDYTGPVLYETIPRFHDMHWRYAQLDEAIACDKAARLSSVKDEVDFLQANRERGTVLSDGLANGRLKSGITHNDTKLNNILFDDASGEAICMIDLDTVMPGTVLFDTGDLIRTATNTGAEDERDLSKVGFNADLFRALIRGYMSEASDFLTDYEKSLIAESGRVFAQIMAVRFLTDYLNGDVYYKIERPSHNLDRARTQLTLIKSMDAQKADIESIMRDF
ncbi:aminoglycoside phosphotransferase family protein [Treponema sp. HNW]|uniref:phosphotransferase enzyme family protein n=1 Tax=Treponema sp. HNW TaxID=3116654 RepID=UPI003D09D969